MKKILLTVAMFTALAASAQNVGINATGAAPAASAALDVDMAGKGVLVPRLALTATNVAAPVTAPATSLLIYNTATAGVFPNNVTPGYYFWNGTIWVRLVNSGNSWELLGNAATNSTTNFIGTTDAVDFVVRTSNTERARMTSGGVFGIGTTTPATSFFGGAVYGLNVVKNTTAANTAMSEVVNSSANGVSLSVDNTVNTNAFNSLEGITTYSGNANIPAGVLGLCLATTGIGNGVSAITNSQTGYGLYAQAPLQNTANVYAIVASGRVLTTGNYFTTSDQRLKTNVRQLQSSLSKIMLMNPVMYDFKPEYSQFVQGANQIGFMAQELEVLLPEAVSDATLRSRIDVTRNGDNQVETFDAKVVNYTALIPVLVDAMQEQQAIIEKQQLELEALKQRILLLEK